MQPRNSEQVPGKATCLIIVCLDAVQNQRMEPINNMATWLPMTFKNVASYPKHLASVPQCTNSKYWLSVLVGPILHWHAGYCFDFLACESTMWRGGKHIFLFFIIPNLFSPMAFTRCCFGSEDKYKKKSMKEQSRLFTRWIFWCLSDSNNTSERQGRDALIPTMNGFHIQSSRSLCRPKHTLLSSA